MANHGRDLNGMLLGLHARTSLHPGAGTALGFVDLPIQREKHTHWPMIQGSSLKGVLRDACRESVKKGHDGDRALANADPDLEAVFGPAKIEAGDNTAWAGAMSVTDARILAFPVRSLKGVFAWVTCPGVLHRLTQDAEIAGRPIKLSTPKVQPDTALAGTEVVVDGHVVFEEFDYAVVGDDRALDEGVNAIDLLASTGPQGSAPHVRGRLAILTDDDFTHLVRFSTEVNARIALDYNTKTVKSGALFYQEFLPPETILYAILLADASRSRASPRIKSSTDVQKFLTDRLPTFLQIGGDETSGKGICAVKVY